MTAVAPATFRPSGTLPVAASAPYAGRWNLRLAAHLLRRAGFGGTPQDRTRYAALTMDAAVEALVQVVPSAASEANLPNVARAGFMELPELVDNEMQPGAGGAGRRRLSLVTADSADPAFLAQRRQRAALRRQQDVANVVWWLGRMVSTPAPLQEKMTLFLHGNFATAARSKGIYGLDIVEQNMLLRKYALGNFQALTHVIARDRAMLKWLDNARSDKAHPNENFARELMELFTLGIGNYTERDVRESARAFTGYTFARGTGNFVFNASQHDDGTKTFLGRTGNFNGDDIIDIIFAQPAAATFLAYKLLEFFVYSDPEPQLTDELAALIRRNRFELEPVLSTLLRSNVFYSDRAYRALVKSPVEFVIGSYQLFGVTDIKPDVIAVLGRMGQVPFHPPSVKGWDGGAQWLNTQRVLARENFASSLMASPAAMQARSPFGAGLPTSANDAAKRLVGAILQGDASPAAIANLEAYLNGTDSASGPLSGENVDERMRGAAYLTMALPAYQLN